MAHESLARVATISAALLVCSVGNAWQLPDSPTIDRKVAATLTKTEVANRYNARVAAMSPEEQAWERVLQENLGGFYLPIHQREKISGISNAWDFVRDDPSLPCVLLIGDSISRGYTLACRKALAGKANVHRAPANCGPTSLGLARLEVWLADGQWDVIHFNFGLHDRHRRMPLSEYAGNLERLIKRMQKSGTKLIWASSTPDKDEPDAKPIASIEEYNAAAARVMQAHEIPVDDLYEVIQPHLDTHQTSDGHFREPGYDILGKHAAQCIEKALK